MDWKWLTPELVQSASIGILTILSAFGWVGNFFKNRKVNSQSVSKTIEKQCLLDEDILNKMEEVKECYNADRVHFYDFHNGVHYSNGRSAKKLSCTYEKTRFGIEPIKRVMKEIETADIPFFLNKLFSECKFGVRDVEKLKEEKDMMYIYMRRSGVKSFYVLSVKNQDKEPIGFIMLQYIQNEMPEIGYYDEYIQKFKWFMEEKLKKML